MFGRCQSDWSVLEEKQNCKMSQLHSVCVIFMLWSSVPENLQITTGSLSFDCMNAPFLAERSEGWPAVWVYYCFQHSSRQH